MFLKLYCVKICYWLDCDISIYFFNLRYIIIKICVFIYVLFLKYCVYVKVVYVVWVRSKDERWFCYEGL